MEIKTIPGDRMAATFKDTEGLKKCAALGRVSLARALSESAELIFDPDTWIEAVDDLTQSRIDDMENDTWHNAPPPGAVMLAADSHGQTLEARESAKVRSEIWFWGDDLWLVLAPDSSYGEQWGPDHMRRRYKTGPVGIRLGIVWAQRVNDAYFLEAIRDLRDGYEGEFAPMWDAHRARGIMLAYARMMLLDQ